MTGFEAFLIAALVAIGVFGMIGFVYGLIALTKIKRLEAQIRSMRSELRMAQGHPALPPVPQWPQAYRAGTQELPAEAQYELRTLVDEGRTIEAIKRVRELTGLGLKEAKDYVDRM